ncbi:Monoterpene epsilon-lactone hydrolase [compost metagenome]
MLSASGLRLAGGLYQRGLPDRDFRVSPIYGDLDGLGKIHLYSGTYDIMNVDARRLVELAGAATATEIVYREKAGGIHIYPLIVQSPGGKEAQDEIIELLHE